MAFLCVMMPSKSQRQRCIVDDDECYGHRAMTVDEFKQRIRQFDADGDGRISRDELRRAMRDLQVRFTRRKSKHGISYADADGDGYIDDGEIDGLVEYARRNLGLRIDAY